MVAQIDEDIVVEFEWDKGNIKKNELKHGIFYKECEEVFLDAPIFLEDVKHSANEKRFLCIGFTKGGRQVFISFTMRKQYIKVISARSVSKTERRSYEKIKKASKI